MKIAHKFLNERNRVVEIDGVKYAFTPADPSDPASPHVAEVVNEAHIQRFLSITEGYHIYSGTSAARPEPQLPDTPGNPAADQVPANDNTGGGTNDTDPEVLDAAKALGELSWQKLSAELSKGDIPKAVATAALQLEEAKSEVDQKATTIRLLQKYLNPQG